MHGLTCLGALSDLRSLILTKVGVTNAVLRSMGGLSRLRSLHAPDAFRVTDAGLAHLAGLTGAKSLLLSLLVEIHCNPAPLCLRPCCKERCMCGGAQAASHAMAPFADEACRMGSVHEAEQL